jgi:isopentenyl phosphate kinase
MPLSNGQFQVFSSDRITAILSRHFKTDQVVFLTDVAGVFAKNSKGEKAERPMPELALRNLQDVYRSASDEIDVSGGMQAKITTALEVASHTTECLIANGQHKNVLAAILAGQDVECTRIVGGVS